MDDLNVIDRFLETFVIYIDSGFGLLGPDIAFLTTILIGIDITLAGLFWAFSDDKSILPSLIKKVLYVGAFAFIINNFSALANIIFNSFAQLGLTATGSPITSADLLRPGFVAVTGYTAAEPLLAQVQELLGPIAFFQNFVLIAVLMIAWLIVLLAFFILAIQLFITILEFKLTTLAGFVLVPFALWNKTSFLAERVLGNVISAGIKLMVLAVIVGIGSTLFGEFTQSFASGNVQKEQALATLLGALSLFILGIFGPGIAAGLVSGAPQLGAGAVAGSAVGLGIGGAAATGAAIGGARMVGSGAMSATRAAASVAGGTAGAYQLGRTASGAEGAAGIASGLGGVARVGAGASPQGGSAPTNAAPAWAQKLRRGQHLREGATIAAHTIRDGDRPVAGENPKLRDDD